MTSFCECDTCKKIKNRINNPECSYCHEHHDPSIHCISEMKQKNNIQNISKDTEEICSSKISLTSEIDFTPGKEGVIIKNTLNPKCTKNLLKETSEYFLDVADEKYSLYQKKNGTLKVLRYGEPCRIVKNDNLIFNMMVELIDAKVKIQEAINCLASGSAYRAMSILKGEE